MGFGQDRCIWGHGVNTKTFLSNTYGVAFVSVSCHLCVCFIWFSCIARVFQFVGDWSLLLTVRCF